MIGLPHYLERGIRLVICLKKYIYINNVNVEIKLDVTQCPLFANNPEATPRFKLFSPELAYYSSNVHRRVSSSPIPDVSLTFLL